MTERRGGGRAVWSEVDLDAIRANVRALCDLVAPAQVLAVVKANGYGHGAAPVARAAVEAGAPWLGVARVEEGVQLRGHGIDTPVLLLSEPPVSAAAAVVTHSITPVVYTEAGVDALAKAVASFGGKDRLSVHLKIDTGMHRVGCDPADALALAERIDASAELDLAGVCTHLAVADEPDNPYTDSQLAQFDHSLRRAARRRSRPGHRARGQFGRRARAVRARVTTWFASASPRTDSRRGRRATNRSRCAPRSRCTLA